MAADNKDVMLVVSLVLSVVSTVWCDLVFPVITGSTATTSRV